MTYKELKHTLSCDLHRYGKGISLKGFILTFADRPGFKITFYMRVCDFIRNDKRILLYPLFACCYLLFRHARFKYGIELKLRSHIAKGLYINHFNGIAIARESIIGENLTILNGVIIGGIGRGPRKGKPNIGSNVFIGSGAKVLGKITIGNNVAIGANAVVLGDVPDNSVVAGNPSRIISQDGSEGLIDDVWDENQKG